MPVLRGLFRPPCQSESYLCSLILCLNRTPQAVLRKAPSRSVNGCVRWLWSKPRIEQPRERIQIPLSGTGVAVRRLALRCCRSAAKWSRW